METEERLALLERKVKQYDSLLLALISYARTTPKGRLILKMLGL